MMNTMEKPWTVGSILVLLDSDDDEAVEKFVNAVNDQNINELARITLENLTPGGSEYHKDPERCAAFIQRVKADSVEAHKQIVRQERILNEAKAAILLYRESHKYCVKGTEQGVCNKCKAAEDVLHKLEGKKDSV